MHGGIGKLKPPIDRAPYVELVETGVRHKAALELFRAEYPFRCLTVVLHDAPFAGRLLMYRECPVTYELQGGCIWCIYDRSECVVTHD